VPEIRPINGRLARLTAYVMMAVAAAASSGPPLDLSRGLQFIALARAVCRDPDPGSVGPTMERIDGLLVAAQQLLADGNELGRSAVGLVIAAGVIAATEPLGDRGGATPA